MRKRPALLMSAALCASAAAGAGSATAQGQRHWVTLLVSSRLHGQPLPNAIVRIQGPDVAALDYPPQALVSDLTGTDGVRTDETGRVRVLLGAGEYHFTVSHAAHRTVSVAVQVPPPGHEEQSDLEFRTRMNPRRGIPEGSAAQARLVVLVVAAQGDAPIADATFELGLLGGDVIGRGLTGPDGKTQPIAVPSVGPTGPTAAPRLRLKVRHPLYEEKWGDIPTELLPPGEEPRDYAVRMDKAAQPGPRASWTACERLAFEALEGWARTKAGDRVVVSDDEISATWTEQREVDGRAVQWEGHVLVSRLNTVSDAAAQRSLVAAMPGRVPTTIRGKEAWQEQRHFWWFGGLFLAHVRYSSERNDVPTPDEARALAEEVAGLLGDCEPPVEEDEEI